MTTRTLDNIELKGKVVFLRCDLNVPVNVEGKILDKTKIIRHKITIQELHRSGAKIIVLSHLGRPKGKVVKELSLNLIMEAFANIMDLSEVTVLPFCGVDIIKKVVKNMRDGEVTFLENIRFYPEEEINDNSFAKGLSQIGDLYVNDAFSVSHRKHVSTYGITKFLPSYIGRALQTELEMLDKINTSLSKPVMAMIGGSKISTKINLLKNLLRKSDFLVIGGAMANTFLLSQGYDIGKSLVEKDNLDIATEIMSEAEDSNCKIILPSDVLVAKSLESNDSIENVSIKNIGKDQSIYDIGEKTIENISNTMAICKTLFWNGPLGVYEKKPFDNSTNVIGRTAAILTKGKILTSVVGGGDTVAALNNEELTGGFSYVSIAGGALIEWLEGKKLPGLEFLN